MLYLHPLARQYLAAPGVNGSIERVWSVGSRMLTYSRHSLAGSRVCQLLRLKRNSELLGMWPSSRVRIAAKLSRASACSGDGLRPLSVQLSLASAASGDGSRRLPA